MREKELNVQLKKTEPYSQKKNCEAVNLGDPAHPNPNSLGDQPVRPNWHFAGLCIISACN